MNKRILLPPNYKWWGLCLLIPSLFFGVIFLFYDWEWSFLKVKLPSWLINHDGIFGQFNNLTDEITLTILVISLLMICFSAEKSEDEFIMHTRLQSLQWAVLVNYIILLLLSWLVYGTDYFKVIICNMLTIPIIFLVRFHWVLWRGSLPKELPKS